MAYTWLQVRDVVDAVLELPPEQRSAYLDAACPEASLRRYVQSLIAAYHANGELLEQPVVTGTLAIEDDPSFWVGRRIGAYQIIETLGEGGMGTVYRAVRADEQFNKQVAIKLIKTGYNTGFALARFKAERQILANLEHPNIARLLDGGTTEQALPYFVMELVEGQPIDLYCDSHTMPITERLRLFRTVCSAVQYAHQNLIVHRDLKPGNILITADGTPKLLDFGIAKILNPESFGHNFDATGGFIRMLTPEFASPEQVRGEPITTATDVYSLGLILYILLTGRRPYTLDTRTGDFARAICSTDPVKPSTAVQRRERAQSQTAGGDNSKALAQARCTKPEKLSRRLSGDLDTIVLMALRKEPQRRYQTVEQFSEDIRRYLEGLPITARKDTYTYRAGKFFQRYKLSITAAALVLLSLMGGLVMTLRQARIARVERARAERRFQDVRALANSLMFDLHDSIQNLPGSTPARKLLIVRALQYLDALAAEAGGDASLQRELATAYQKVGTVEGNPFGANLGDLNAAAVNYRKAEHIWRSLATSDPNNIQNQVGLLQSSRLLAQVLCNSGHAECLQAAERSVAAAEHAAAIAPNDSQVRAEQTFSYDLAATALDGSGDFNQALAYLRKELVIAQQRLADHPRDEMLRHQLAVAHVKMADALARIGDRADALEHSLSGLNMFQALAADPSNARYRRELAVVQSRRGDILLLDGNQAGATESYRRALATLQPLSQADPANALLRTDLALHESHLGNVLNRLGTPDQALLRLEHAVAVLQEQLGRDSTNTEVRKYLAFSYTWKADTLAQQRKTASALESYRKARAQFQAISNAYPKDQTAKVNVARVQLKIASVLAQQTKYSDAEREYNSALSVIEPLASANPPNEEARYALINAYYGIATLTTAFAAQRVQSLQARAQHWREARQYFAKALDAFSRIKNAGAASPQLFDLTPRLIIIRALARAMQH